MAMTPVSIKWEYTHFYYWRFFIGIIKERGCFMNNYLTDINNEKKLGEVKINLNKMS